MELHVHNNKIQYLAINSRATCNSSFHTEHVHGSAFSNQTHFWILIPNQKRMVLISPIILTNLSVELYYILDQKAKIKCIPVIINRKCILNAIWMSFLPRFYLGRNESSITQVESHYSVVVSGQYNRGQKLRIVGEIFSLIGQKWSSNRSDAKHYQEIYYYNDILTVFRLHS
jgi:hypothetical protein